MQIQLTIQYTIKQPSLNYFKTQRQDLNHISFSHEIH